MPRPCSFFRWFRYALPWVLLLGATRLAAARFSETLTPEESAACGLARLQDDQRRALDTQVQRDITLARQGDVVGFARTFSQRRTPAQRAETGLDKLDDAECRQLDSLIDRAIARRPAAAFAPAPKPKVPESVKVGRPPLEFHGQLSLEYGWSEAGSYRGGSMDLVCYDPVTRLTVGVGLATYSGYLPWWVPYDYDRPW